MDTVVSASLQNEVSEEGSLKPVRHVIQDTDDALQKLRFFDFFHLKKGAFLYDGYFAI